MADTKISAETLAGTLDGTEQVPLIQVGSPVSAGSFVTGTAYFILSVGSTDFTAIGAASNTVGLLFIATGAGSGTGTAGAALNRRASTQSVADLASGNFRLISTLTASGSAQLDFTGLTGGTKTYKAIGRLLVPATNDATLHLRMGTGGGPTYDTGNNYRSAGWALGTGTGFNASYYGEAQSTIKLHIGQSSTGVGAAFELTFSGTTVIGTFSSSPSSDNHDYGGALHGRWSGGTTFTAIEFHQSAGNITSGSISLYEIKT